MPVKKKTTKKTKNGFKLSVEGPCDPKEWKNKCESKSKGSGAGCGFGYFMGFIGAAVYYISTATGFWNGVLGFLKAIVWPAFLVYELLKFLLA